MADLTHTEKYYIEKCFGFGISTGYHDFIKRLPSKIRNWNEIFRSKSHFICEMRGAYVSEVFMDERKKWPISIDSNYVFPKEKWVKKDPRIFFQVWYLDTKLENGAPASTDISVESVEFSSRRDVTIVFEEPPETDRQFCINYYFFQIW